MADHSAIEWTQATWNPIVGCSILSPGCKGCYAMKDAWRLMHNPNARVAAKFAGTAKVVNGHPVWTGQINLDEAALLAPLKRAKPTMYFVNSMSDLFHEDVANETIDRIFAVMALCPQHTFQVLVKRSARMREWLDRYSKNADQVGELIERMDTIGAAAGTRRSSDQFVRWPLPNVWLGVSVEDQHRADERVPDLLATPAAMRFLSCEPLLGPVDLTSIDLPGGWHQVFPLGQEWLGRPHENDDGNPMTRIDWVIAGGESGPRARPMHPDWARSLRDQCAATGVTFFFKQWGSWLLKSLVDAQNRALQDFCSCTIHDGTSGPFLRVGKKSAGRLLDGVEHNGVPS